MLYEQHLSLLLRQEHMLLQKFNILLMQLYFFLFSRWKSLVLLLCFLLIFLHRFKRLAISEGSLRTCLSKEKRLLPTEARPDLHFPFLLPLLI